MSLVNRVIQPDPAVSLSSRHEQFGSDRTDGAAAAAPVLVALGSGLALAGWVDIAMFYLSPQFGRAEWEFGIIAQTIDSLPLGVLGLGLVGAGALLRRWNRLVRAVAFAFGLIALLLVALLGIYALDIPLAMKVMQAPDLAVPLRRSIGKALLLGVTYVGVMVATAITLWRGANGPDTGRRRPARAA